MRVPNKTLYSTMRLRLGNLTEELKKSNEILSTGKRINNLSDDPVSLSQVLSLKSSLKNIEQLEKNIDIGKTWLEGGETALTSVNDQILYVKNLCLQLTNASANATQRADAVEIIDGVLRQIVSLANTEVNGASIFAGTKTQETPFLFDDKTNPAQVLYNGNETPFAIKSDKTSDISVGRNGETLFWEDYVIVDSTNNHLDFIEKKRSGNGGHEITNIQTGGNLASSDVSVTVNNYDALMVGTPHPKGTEPLKLIWDGNGNWDVFNDPGYDLPVTIAGTTSQVEIDLEDDGITDFTVNLAAPAVQGDFVELDITPTERIISAEITEGKYTADTLETAVENALNDASDSSGFSVQYKVSYDDINKKFTITDNGEFSGFVATTFLWEENNGEGIPKVRNINTGGGIPFSDVSIRVRNSEALTYGTPYPPGTEPMRLTWNGTDAWTVSGNPGYTIPDSFAGSSDSVDIDLEGDGSADIVITLDNPAAASGGYVEFDLLPNLGKYSIGPDMGFNSVMENTSATSDVEFTRINNITIDHTNNRIDFQEVDPVLGAGPVLTAIIPVGDYADPDALSLAIETAMETESSTLGYTVNYSVSYDSENSMFVFKEDGVALSELRMLWNSGPNTGINSASILGFDDVDDIVTIPSSDNVVRPITINTTNNIIDFQEDHNVAGISGMLAAVIPPGTYTADELAIAAEAALEAESVAFGNSINYDVSYAASRFTIGEDPGAPVLNDLYLLWETGASSSSSAAETLGFDALSDDVGATTYTGDSDAVLVTIDAANNRIDFEEFDSVGFSGGELSAVIPQGDYTDLNVLASAIEAAMESESAASGHGIDYSITFDAVNIEFVIRENGTDLDELHMLWNTGSNTDTNAASVLGFDNTSDDILLHPKSDSEVIRITIDDTNNRIDFKETTEGVMGEEVCELCAVIAEGDYTDANALAAAVESAMEAESYASGNNIDYEVTYDEASRRFTIKESGYVLKKFSLLWESGSNASENASSVLGYDAEDDIITPVESADPVEWGIFKTLFDLKDYLSQNNVDGVIRSTTRLETHFNHITSTVSDTGIKYNRLEIKNQIMTDVGLSLTERQVNLEEADIIDTVMKLNSLEIAYQASLSSTSRIMKLSLADYL
jgi:flagellar hook-associated protein 3